MNSVADASNQKDWIMQYCSYPHIINSQRYNCTKYFVWIVGSKIFIIIVHNLSWQCAGWYSIDFNNYRAFDASLGPVQKHSIHLFLSFLDKGLVAHKTVRETKIVKVVAALKHSAAHVKLVNRRSSVLKSRDFFKTGFGSTRAQERKRWVLSKTFKLIEK